MKELYPMMHGIHVSCSILFFLITNHVLVFTVHVISNVYGRAQSSGGGGKLGVRRKLRGQGEVEGSGGKLKGQGGC